MTMLVNRAALLEQLDDPERLWTDAVETLASAGFDHAIYLTVDHDFTAPFLRCTAPAVYAHHPPEKDPFLRYACDSYRILPLGAEFIDAHPYVTEEERAFVRRAAEAGMRSCLGIPMRLRGSERFGGFIVGTARVKSSFMEKVFPRAEEIRLFCLLIHRRLEELTAATPVTQGEVAFGRHLVAPDLPDTFEALTPREREVVYLLAQGHSRQETAAICTISVHTVSDYAKSAYRKLGVHNRAQVAALIYHGDAAP
ncbi:hypothetical protein BOO69_01645 [Sulfitobacter alexandrii]|uniref:HTH luxR-type domain-containing protein n=1 Tax=Sulfitobacter alexandrii TaxID=1917485 RepID=A0A1J0WDM1_9RHOB|nr:LuxR family transcriptional regulator [Sulfitobacter alexandrii]APE42262.1 hypothetical protein BOO69_01645 [Sulfitobacter alexandrii]